MAEASRLTLKFWGVRGSTPTPQAENLGFGGNTSCLEICSAGGDRIIIDAGTGIRNLGRHLMKDGGGHDLHLFLTHFHWDHIQGLPFFAPLLLKGNRIHFHSFPSPRETCARLQHQMASPYFTLDFNAVGAERQYASVDGVFQQGEINVTAFPLHHPQGASGYRVESNGAVIVVATDMEHGDAALDKVLRRNTEGADVLIYDSQYTPDEYRARQGWGHSTYVEAARAARDARVRRLVLFHHDPAHDDRQMTGIVNCACEIFANTAGARELETVFI